MKKNMALMVWAHLGRRNPSLANEYFRRRIMSALVDGCSHRNRCDLEGIHLSHSELVEVVPDLLSLNFMTTIAIHECIHYDMRHPHQTLVVVKALMKRYPNYDTEGHADSRRYRARLQIMSTVVEWQTNQYMMSVIEDMGLNLSEVEMTTLREVGDMYETASSMDRQMVGDQWSSISPMRLALTMSDQDVRSSTDRMDELKDEMSDLARKLREVMKMTPPDTESKSSDNGAPSANQVLQGGMSASERLMHEASIASDADSSKYQGAHVHHAMNLIINMRKSRVDPIDMFRQYLSEQLGGSRDNWARPNKAFKAHGTHWPSSVSLKLRNLAVIVDTSGSMSHYELSSALGVVYQCGSVLRGTTMTLYSVDTDVRRVEQVYELSDLEQSFTLTGGGGTDFSKAFKDLEEDIPQVLMVITDGYVHVDKDSDPNIPTVWVLTNPNDQFKPPFGKVVNNEVA